MNGSFQVIAAVNAWMCSWNDCGPFFDCLESMSLITLDAMPSSGDVSSSSISSIFSGMIFSVFVVLVPSWIRLYATSNTLIMSSPTSVNLFHAHSML